VRPEPSRGHVSERMFLKTVPALQRALTHQASELQARRRREHYLRFHSAYTRFAEGTARTNFMIQSFILLLAAARYALSARSRWRPAYELQIASC